MKRKFSDFKHEEAPLLVSGVAVGSGCSTMVERTPHDSEVPSRRVLGFFFLVSPISSASIIQVPHGDATQLIFFYKK